MWGCYNWQLVPMVLVECLAVMCGVQYELLTSRRRLGAGRSAAWSGRQKMPPSPDRLCHYRWQPSDSLDREKDRQTDKTRECRQKQTHAQKHTRMHACTRIHTRAYARTRALTRTQTDRHTQSNSERVKLRESRYSTSLLNVALHLFSLINTAAEINTWDFLYAQLTGQFSLS